jgi:hypothetical protein
MLAMVFLSARVTKATDIKAGTSNNTTSKTDTIVIGKFNIIIKNFFRTF